MNIVSHCLMYDKYVMIIGYIRSMVTGWYNSS